jgi:hypothetical protein
MLFTTWVFEGLVSAANFLFARGCGGGVAEIFWS